MLAQSTSMSMSTHTARRRGVGASLETRAEVLTNDQSAIDGLRVGEKADADEEEEERVDAREEHGCGCGGELREVAD